MIIVDIGSLSNKYAVRRMTSADIDMIYAFCLKNTVYYEYCGESITKDVIKDDLVVAPPGIPSSQKYYIGFFDGDSLVAVMDLIDGYPETNDAFIGFFMMSVDYQGKNIGSSIISEVRDTLKGFGCVRCRLGIDKDNPQSNHFWMKNGFEIIKEVHHDRGCILVAERIL